MSASLWAGGTTNFEAGITVSEQDDPDYVAHRMSLALSRRPVMPASAVSYRLCDVGSHRLDPRVLEQYLPRLCAAGDEVVRTDDGLYARADMPTDERRERSTAALHALAGLGLTRLGGSRNSRETVLETTQYLRQVLDENGWQTVLEHENPPALMQIASVGHAATIRVVRPHGVAPLLVLVTHSVDWLYPDAPELWAHAMEAAKTGAHPVYLARKVAAICFPLLAALNARALQYYDLLVREVPSESTIREANGLGLPRLCATSQLPMHSMFSQLLALIEERPQAMWTPSMDVAFTDAIRRGFADTAVTPSAVADWAEQHPDLPSRWTAGIRIWANGRERPAGTIPPRRKKSESTKSAPVFGRTTKVSRVPFRV